MQPPAGCEWSELTPDDRPALEVFPCAGVNQSWAAAVEHHIRAELADSLLLGTTYALGLWCAEELVGVAAWQLDGRNATSIAIAVRTDKRGDDYGLQMKQEVGERAGLAGASALISHVHVRNTYMQKINETLGAEAVDWGKPDHTTWIWILDAVGSDEDRYDG